ncbi:MAG: hypothetical protein WDW38_002574 [Sanguina aurantia]
MAQDYGASQFGGGGFMSRYAFAHLSPTSYATHTKGTGNATLRSVTVRQLLKENSHVTDDQYTVDGIEISTITFIGRILSTKDEATKMTLMVNDTTGTVEVVSWNSDDNDGGAAQFQSVLSQIWIG